MNNNTTAPTYTLRGLQLIGWRDMQHALDYLFADGQLKQGTLVAINAEKMLTIEDNAEVRELINAAEFKYADGISVVRSVRKKYPQAQVSRVAGADPLGRADGARRQRRDAGYFLVGGKPEVLAQTEAKLRNQWNVNIVAVRMVILNPSSVRRCLNAFMPAERKSSPLRWDRQSRRSSCATAVWCIQMRCIWALAGLTMFSPVT